MNLVTNDKWIGREGKELILAETNEKRILMSNTAIRKVELIRHALKP